MPLTATWFLIVGFVLLVLGVVIRTVVMMRASDSTAPSGQILHGRELVQQYQRLFPQRRTTVLMRVVVIAGLVLLVLGFGLELYR